MLPLNRRPTGAVAARADDQEVQLPAERCELFARVTVGDVALDVFQTVQPAKLVVHQLPSDDWPALWDRLAVRNALQRDHRERLDRGSASSRDLPSGGERLLAFGRAVAADPNRREPVSGRCVSARAIATAHGAPLSAALVSSPRRTRPSSPRWHDPTTSRLAWLLSASLCNARPADRSAHTASRASSEASARRCFSSRCASSSWLPNSRVAARPAIRPMP